MSLADERWAKKPIESLERSTKARHSLSMVKMARKKPNFLKKLQSRTRSS